MSRNRLLLLLAPAFALSIGWGIRGNFGHETGAMIPGALAALAGVVVAGRKDWHERAALFAFFGALGWSFGGSISYMQVIGYTHSGHSVSVIYGYANLFVIGFLWGIFGGAGTALPASLSTEKLKSFFPPLLAIFAAWVLQDWLVYLIVDSDPAYRHRDPLYWYDTDWLGVLVALITVLILAGVRQTWDYATSLVVHMTVGWWIGFLLLVVVLKLRMTPPRGDNWAGCLGMACGLCLFLWRQRESTVLASSIIAGAAGGFGFSFAQLAKLLGIKTGWVTNWHSILEQTYGFINGIGIALVFLFLLRAQSALTDPKPLPSWQRKFCWGFVLLGITWLNFKKNPGTWLKAGSMPETIHGISPQGWFNLAYLIAALLFLFACWIHGRRPLPFMPNQPLGRAQIFFLIFLFWVVVGNFERALVGFAEMRLVTEGVIYLNAIICMFLLFAAGNEDQFPSKPIGWTLPPIATAALLLLCATTFFCWGVTRLVYGDQLAGHANLHIRFGPKATATKAAPAADKPHP